MWTKIKQLDFIYKLSLFNYGYALIFIFLDKLIFHMNEEIFVLLISGGLVAIDIPGLIYYVHQSGKNQEKSTMQDFFEAEEQRYAKMREELETFPIGSYVFLTEESLSRKHHGDFYSQLAQITGTDYGDDGLFLRIQYANGVRGFVLAKNLRRAHPGELRNAEFTHLLTK